MALRSVFRLFSKDDGLGNSLQKLGILNDAATEVYCQQVATELAKLRQSQAKEEETVKMLVEKLEKKKSMIAKLKILLVLMQMCRRSTWDIPQLLIAKKMKVFCQESTSKKIGHTFELVNSNKEEYIHKYVLLPVYNYMIKVSMNEELFETCHLKEIPHDDIFRRGQKIRFIWVFKVFNLINLLVPTFDPLCRLHVKYPEESLWPSLALQFYTHILTFTGFISRCIAETLELSNPLLLPYTDCLQFYESIKEYKILQEKMSKQQSDLRRLLKDKYTAIQFVVIEPEVVEELQIVAVRIQLISNSLRNGSNPSNERLVTEYNEKVEIYQTRLKTEGNEDY